MTDRPAVATTLPIVFFGALCCLLPLIIVGEVTPTLGDLELRLRYKEALRAIAIAWVALQLLPAGRAALPYRPERADLPLAAFAIAVVLSVALGGAHWGTVRTLLGSIGLGLLGRALFAPPARRVWLVHHLGAAVVLIVAWELLTVPNLLPPFQPNRYRLVTANPNVLGFAFAMMTPVFIGAALARRGAGRLPFVAYGAVALLGALLTFSRSAAVGLAVGALTIVLCEQRRARALALGAVLAAVFFAFLRPDVWIGDRAPGDRDRLRIIHTSLTLFADRPVLGVGFGIKNLERHFPDRYAELYGAPLFRYHSANQLVDLLAGTGLIGTALFVWWWWRLWTAAAAQRGRGSPACRQRAAGNLGVLAAITVMSMAEPPLYHGKLLPLLFLLLAWVQLDPVDDRDDPVSRG